MVKPVVRVAAERDLDQMLSLWLTLEAAQRSFRVLPTRPEAEKRITLLMREAIEDPDSRALVVEGAGGLLGMAIAHIAEQARDSMSESTVVELSRVVVLPEARGTGVGRALIEAAEEFGRARGAAYLTAKTFTGNVAGRGFWDRLGFIPRYEQRVRPIEASGAADILGPEEAD
jgi:GNAT superfamily N-acetyltransferase